MGGSNYDCVLAITVAIISGNGYIYLSGKHTLFNHNMKSDSLHERSGENLVKPAKCVSTKLRV